MSTATVNSPTYFAKPGEIQADWHIIDATDQVLGRLASRVAVLLQGKHKPTYTPHVDTGDFIVIINAEKIRVTGNKAGDIEYDTYTSYTSGRKVYSFERMQEKHPEKLVGLAVRRMLPKTKLGRSMFTKLKVYAGTEHPHAAQQPKELKL